MSKWCDPTESDASAVFDQVGGHVHQVSMVLLVENVT